MSCNILLLLAGFVSVFTLNSCATPERQKAGAVTPAKVVLRDLGNGVCHQLPAGLMWQIKKSKMISTQEEADEYVKRLQLAGFDDWRLPTHNECLFLSELLMMKKGDCPIKKSTKGYWVSNGKKGESGFWDDYLLCGGPEFHWVTSKKGYVRAVRP
ncbi:MAG: DUF1566 domain-containing protein [Deltaproteobacteria bacterium]|nr:DUF1566 domain-containing protein [Deltaproteobacteria bacterium]